MRITSYFKHGLLLLASSLLVASCTDTPDNEWWWYGKDKPEEEEPVVPDTPDTPVEEGKVFTWTDANGVVQKPRFMWIDASGNFERFANSKENIATDLEKAYNAGVTDIVVDVRPFTGDVLFNTNVGEKLTSVPVWSSKGYCWYERTETWDYLQAFIDEGHKLGLRVNAAINTFVGGYMPNYGLANGGMLFRDSSKKSWAETLNTADGIVNTMDLVDPANGKGDYGTKFLNPANDEVQEYLLTLLEELAQYDIDGIVLDRCRYGDYDLQADFSDISRAKFEEFIGAKVENWPADVLPAGTTSTLPSATTWYKKWFAFRAKVIHDFIVKAKERIEGVNSNIRFGVYVGAWYSTYYLSGVNWASPSFKASTNKSYSQWASADWDTYGYADHLDFLLAGAYASATSIYGTSEWSCEGMSNVVKTCLCGDIPFASGPDVGNGTGWVDGNQGTALTQSVDACINVADGYFIFDMCHVRKYSYWDAFKNGVNQYVKSLY